MKINFSKPEAESNAKQLETIDLKMGSSLIIADLLRKHYQNPRKTMIQEYLSNARDAHREVNSDKKILITLPSKKSPNLIIRDFGPGLNKDRFENYFCSYASSTKTKSDDQTGGFGIGSKSAWAYRENFFVKNYYNGNVSFYEASTHEKYEGSLKKISSKDTSESNGLEIIIPIKEEDLAHVVQDVQQITYFWNCISYSNLDDDISINKHNIVYEDEDVVVIDNDKKLMTSINMDKNIAILNDGIIYPTLPLTVVAEFKKRIPNSFNLFLKFNEKKLRPTISREYIEKCDYNEKLIEEKINKIIEKIETSSKQFQGQVEEAEAWIDLVEASENVNPILKYCSIRHYATFKLGFLDAWGQVKFTENVNYINNSIYFTHVEPSKTINLSNQVPSLSINAELKFIEITGYNNKSINLKAEAEDGSKYILIKKTFNCSEDFFQRVKMFLNYKDNLTTINIKEITENKEKENQVFCQYLSIRGNEYSWAEKFYSVSKISSYNIIDESVKEIPFFFLVEVAKHFRNNKNSHFVIPPSDYVSNEKIMNIEDIKLSPAWNEALRYLIQTIAQDKNEKINYLINYGFLTNEEMELVNDPVFLNPIILETEGFVFSRIKNNVNKDFLEFLKKHDETHYKIINDILSYEEKIKNIVESPRYAQFFRDISSGILPSSPSQEYFNSIERVIELRNNKS